MSLMTFEFMQIAMEQMKKCVCKIKLKDIQGTGFFSKIPFPDINKRLPVIITNNHIINEELLNTKGSKIIIDIKEEDSLKEISLDNRITFTNREYDITLIEIKETDNINNYLELDDIIIDDILNNNNKNMVYVDNEVYIIGYPEGKLSISSGQVNDIFEDKKYIFLHQCRTKVGSAGSPILNISNNKVIGVHHSALLNFKNKNGKATFLNYPIKEFIKIANH